MILCGYYVIKNLLPTNAANSFLKRKVFCMYTTIISQLVPCTSQTTATTAKIEKHGRSFITWLKRWLKWMCNEFVEMWKVCTRSSYLFKCQILQNSVWQFAHMAVGKFQKGKFSAFRGERAVVCISMFVLQWSPDGMPTNCNLIYLISTSYIYLLSFDASMTWSKHTGPAMSKH